MRRFAALFVVFLTSCVSGQPYKEETYFIDSNVAADVYCDGQKIGRTPMEIKTSTTCELELKKEGYRSTSFRFQNLEKYASFPKDDISKHHGLLSKHIGNVTLSVQEYISRKDIEKHKYPLMTLALTSGPVGAVVLYPLFVFTYAGIVIVIDGALEILALPVDLASIGTYASKNGSISSENSSATSYNATSIDIVIPYDEDSFFFELLPENKKTFNQKDLQELRTKLFVLKNFNELKFRSPEYVKTLEFLVGGKSVLPAPAMTPGKYFEILLSQREEKG